TASIFASITPDDGNPADFHRTMEISAPFIVHGGVSDSRDGTGVTRAAIAANIFVNDGLVASAFERVADGVFFGSLLPVIPLTFVVVVGVPYRQDISLSGGGTVIVGGG